MTDGGPDLHSSAMILAAGLFSRVRNAVPGRMAHFLLALGLITACDRTRDPDMGQDDGMDDDDDDDASASDEVWIRGLLIGGGRYSFREVRTVNDCVMTSTLDIESVDGELSVGIIFVGQPTAEGDLVLGTVSLAGAGVATQKTSGDCGPGPHTDTTTPFELAGGQMTMRAPTAYDMMVLAVDAYENSPGYPQLQATTFAASELREAGVTKTLRLDAMDAVDVDGVYIEASVSLEVDIETQ